jgi:hypothetical protein
MNAIELHSLAVAVDDEFTLALWTVKNDISVRNDNALF